MRLSVVATCLYLCLIGISVADDARASIRKVTNIPTEELGTALETLAKDRDFQIVYVSEEIENVRTPGAIGEFTPEEALKRLLSGTGLTYRYLDDKTVTIVAATTPPEATARAPSPTSEDANSAKEGKNGSSGGFRVAQVDQGTALQSSAVTSTTSTTQEGSNKVGLEEVVVTAQKREQRLIDVPISIVAIGADDLKKRELTSIEDLISAVPGLSVEYIGNQHRVYMRGISNNQGGGSLTGFYLDDSDITANQTTQPDVQLYDLERVEVLRGPQGTLYGEGSVGGTIRFITKKPVLDRFQMDADVASLFTQNGAPGQRIQAVVNVPLINDELGIRVAGDFDHKGGWVNQPTANQTNINGENIADVRLKTLWQPIREFELTGVAEIHRNNAGSNTGEDANGNFIQPFGHTTTPRSVDNFDIFGLTMNYDFAAARLLNTTTYVHQILDTYNNGWHFIYNGPPPAPTDGDYVAFTSFVNNGLSDELRLTSIGSSPWQWTVGAFYKNFRSRDIYSAGEFGVESPPGAPASGGFPGADIVTASKAWSLFGDTSYKFGTRLTVGAGIRRYSDDESVPDQKGTFHSVDPRYYVNFKLTDQATVYASAAKGFRSGGFNFAPTVPTYGPETIWTYELGTKLSLLDQRISLDSDVFYSRYADYIIFGAPKTLRTSGFSGAYSQNAGDAVIKGIEANFTWIPVEHWTLGFNGDYLDSYFTTINLTPASSPYAVGDNLDYLIKYQYAASVEHQFKMWDRGGFARAEYSVIGPQTVRYRTIPGYYSKTAPVNLLNLAAGLDLNANLSVGMFAQNLLNDRGYIGADVIDSQAARERPRTYGVSFSVKFD